MVSKQTLAHQSRATTPGANYDGAVTTPFVPVVKNTADCKWSFTEGLLIQVGAGHRQQAFQVGPRKPGV